MAGDAGAAVFLGDATGGELAEGAAAGDCLLGDLAPDDVSTLIESVGFAAVFLGDGCGDGCSNFLPSFRQYGLASI